MDKFTAMKMFVYTVDFQGFSSAARELNVATSSISRMIDNLEAELGTVLLNRTTRRITVTDAGSTYYMRARQLLDDMAEVEALIQDKGDELSGPLRVSLPSSYGRNCIAPFLGEFLTRHPKLELDVMLTDDIVDLMVERIDVSIRLGKISEMEMIVCKRVGEFSRKLVASPDYLKTIHELTNPMDISNYQSLVFSYGKSLQKWTFIDKTTLKNVEVPIRGHVRSNNMEVLYYLTIANKGFSLLPNWLIDEDVKAGRLISLFDNFSINPNSTDTSISALYLPNHRLSRRVQAFIEFIKEITSSH